MYRAQVPQGNYRWSVVKEALAQWSRWECHCATATVLCYCGSGSFGEGVSAVAKRGGGKLSIIHIHAQQLC